MLGCRSEQGPFSCANSATPSVHLAADRRFTAAAVALLSLTIGASTAIYAIVHAVILRPLPFAEPGPRSASSGSATCAAPCR